MSAINIIEAINDPNLFRPFLADGNDDISTWANWFTAHRVVHGLPLRPSERDLLLQCTGRSTFPRNGFNEALFLVGRRSGKSRMAAVAAAYEATLAGHESKLSAGERGVVLVVSPIRPQSRVVWDYIRAIFQVPLLAAEIVRETQNSFELRNGTRIEIAAGDFRSVRGYTLLAAIVDEVCFFGYDVESKVRSDAELIRAIRPALATVGGKLIAISSPYAAKGWAYSAYKKNFGNDSGRVLVWNAPSRTMNPTLPQSVVDAAMEEDLAAARAEYLAEFRDDVSSYLPREVIEACVVQGRSELPPLSQCTYAAFVDISGGRSDDAALAIAHIDDKGMIVVDLIRRWQPPFSPDHVIGEMVAVLRRYHVDRATGDNYSAEFTKQAFEARGIEYERATTNPWGTNQNAKVAKPKSVLYAELLPRLCSREIELLDNEVLINQLAGLERRTRSGGRDIIDHGPNQHDDVANVIAGVADCVSHQPIVLGRPMWSADPSEDNSAVSAFARRKAEYDKEQRRMAEPETYAEGFQQALREGRVTVIGPENPFMR